jgi:choline dehydrogenase-like flavoprotein
MSGTLHPIEAEAIRRRERLALGLPLHETPEEMASEERRVLELERGKREKAIEAECDRRMGALGWTVIRFSMPRATRQTLGIPDRRYQSVRRRVCVWHEVKAPDGEQSTPQREFMERERACGHAYVLGGVGDLERWLVTNAYAIVDISGQWVNP